MGLTESEELELLQLERDRTQPVVTPSADGVKETQPEKKRGMLGQLWEDLKWPQEKAKEGLGIITRGGVDAQNAIAEKTGLPIGTEPTGNMARDLAANTPRILGETLQETAPSFVSRRAIVTAGLLKGASKVTPLLKGLAKWAAGSAEEQSGLANKGKELLSEAYKDPTLIFGKGRRAANAMYDEVQAGGKMIRPDLVETSNPTDFIAKAIQYGRDGTLTSDEALEARKMLWDRKDQIAKPFFDFAHAALDEVAKRDYSGADAAFRRATQSEALRGLSSWNKTGGQSKTTLGAMLIKPITAVAYSPILQGSVASGLGAIHKGAAALYNNRPAMSAGFGIADNISKLMQKRKEHSNGK